jgi:hypothetical protein
MFDWDQDDLVDVAAIVTAVVVVGLALVGAGFLFSKLWVIVS